MTGYQSTPDNARTLAQCASESLRALNHATLPADGCPGLAQPSDAYDLLAALTELTARLPQLLEQISCFLQLQLQLDIVSVDGGEFTGDPLGAVGTACHALEHDAAPHAQRLASAVGRAQQATVFLAQASR